MDNDRLNNDQIQAALILTPSCIIKYNSLEEKEIETTLRKHTSDSPVVSVQNHLQGGPKPCSKKFILIQLKRNVMFHKIWDMIRNHFVLSTIQP